MTFTDFLLNVLYILIDDSGVNKQQFFNPDNLLKTCAKYIGKDKIKETDYIKAVYCYRIIFDYYVLRIDGNGSYRLAAAGDESHNKLEQYQAMLYSGSSRFTYYQWIPVVLKYINDHIIKDDVSEKELNDNLLVELKVTDSKIEEHKIDKFIDNTSFKGFNNYFFRRLDYYLWERFVDDNSLLDLFPQGFGKVEESLKKAIVDYKFHQYNSVEHFEPRNEDEQITKWEDEKMINSFGNLALVSGSFNSTQNNDSLKLKFARVDDQILKENKLESIKLAIMFYTANKEAAKWTPTLMQEHEEIMIEVLEESYQK